MEWLTREITTGFQKLLCLGLDRTPATDLLQGTVGAWLEALTTNRQWDRERDTPRIRKAFVTLAQTRRAWPVPADFIDALARIEAVRALPARVTDPDRPRRIVHDLAKELRA